MATKREKIRPEQENEGRGKASSSATQDGRSSGGALEGRRAGGAQSMGRGNIARSGILQSMDAERLARGLGWFSLGLGLAEILAPRAVAKIAGVRGRNSGLIRLFGLREIASGVAIFAQGKRPATALWSRVAGDALDITSLALAFASPDSDKGRVAFATANVLGVTALDVLCAQRLSSTDADATGGNIQVQKTLIVNRSPEEIYRFWRDFQNLPRFMYHLESVRVTGEGRSHWVAKAPAGTTVEWDAEIIEDRPNELIAWRSLEGADVDNSGSVRFERATGGRGTLVRVQLEYNPPGGVLGATVAKLFGEEPLQQLNDDLRRFKQVIETGEVVISESAITGTGTTPLRPGQPPSERDGR